MIDLTIKSRSRDSNPGPPAYKTEKQSPSSDSVERDSAQPSHTHAVGSGPIGSTTSSEKFSLGQMVDNGPTTYEALCRDPETARWMERVRRIRGRA